MRWPWCVRGNSRRPCTSTAHVRDNNGPTGAPVLGHQRMMVVTPHCRTSGHSHPISALRATGHRGNRGDVGRSSGHCHVPSYPVVSTRRSTPQASCRINHLRGGLFTLSAEFGICVCPAAIRQCASPQALLDDAIRPTIRKTVKSPHQTFVCGRKDMELKSRGHGFRVRQGRLHRQAEGATQFAAVLRYPLDCLGSFTWAKHHTSSKERN